MSEGSETKSETEKRVAEIISPYRAYINDTPRLLSLLYDIDMLPEQTVTVTGAIRLAAFCEVWKLVPPEAFERQARG